MALKVIAFALFLFVLVPGASNSQTPSTRQRIVYACPMHPDVTSTKRGRCRKCGMELRPVKPEPKTFPTPSPTPPGDIGLQFSSAKIPNTRILDQNGKQLNFYDDLIKGKTVAINFIFTTCTTVCPPLTATFRKVQQIASERGLDVKLISISVDPVVDTPERMRAFAEKFKPEQGWTFVTGEKGEIDSLLQALGVAVTSKNDHTPMIIIGNDTLDYWTRAYGLSSPSTIVDSIAHATGRK